MKNNIRALTLESFAAQEWLRSDSSAFKTGNNHAGWVVRLMRLSCLGDIPIEVAQELIRGARSTPECSVRQNSCLCSIKTDDSEPSLKKTSLAASGS